MAHCPIVLLNCDEEQFFKMLDLYGDTVGQMPNQEHIISEQQALLESFQAMRTDPESIKEEEIIEKSARFKSTVDALRTSVKETKSDEYSDFITTSERMSRLLGRITKSTSVNQNTGDFADSMMDGSLPGVKELNKQQKLSSVLNNTNHSVIDSGDKHSLFSQYNCSEAQHTKDINNSINSNVDMSSQQPNTNNSNHQQEMEKIRKEFEQTKANMINDHEKAMSEKNGILPKTYEEQRKAKDMEISQLRDELERLSEKLSEEWNDRVGAKENNLENVNIKNRPMNIAEEYEHLRTQEWLDAKNELDKHDDCEQGKLEILCEILIKSADVAKLHYLRMFFKIYARLTCLVGAQGEQKSSNKDISASQTSKKSMAASGTSSTSMRASHYSSISLSQIDVADLQNSTKLEEEYDNIPQNLKNAIGDFFRISIDSPKFNMDTLSKDIEASLVTPQSKFSNIVDKIIQNTGEIKKIINTYIKKCELIAWKMVIQRPSMKFDSQAGVGKRWKGEKLQNIHYGSDDPDDPKCAVLCYVHPALIHGTLLMAKPTVYVTKSP